MRRSSSIIPIICLTTAVALLGFFSLTSCFPEPVEPPRPLFNYKTTAEGCANIRVYKWNQSNTEAIHVSANKDMLGLSTTTKTFRIDSVDEGLLSVWVDAYNAPVTNSPYCTDIMIRPAPTPSRWQAVSGWVTITLDRDTVPDFETYRATVKIENVHFRGENGVEVELDQLTFDNVLVGWLPG